MQRLAIIALATACLLAACWSLTRARRATFPGQSSNESSNSPATLAALLSGNQAARQPASSTLSQANSTSPASPGLVSSPFPPLAQSSEPPRKRAWDRHFLSTLSQTARGEGIRFELVDGVVAQGYIDRLVRSNAGVDSVSGTLTEPEPGRFFFHKQTLPGVAGELFGIVEFAASKRAYRIEPGTGGVSELVERRLNAVCCLELPHPSVQPAGAVVAKIPPLNPADFPDVPTPDYQQGVVILESLAGAKAVIYLDFAGGYTESWGGIDYAPSNYGNEEIRAIWERVAEDYFPFTINVTTDRGVYDRAPWNSRQRVIITPTDTVQPGAGGASYVGSFNSTTEVPCWVFITNGASYCAEACSHEAGHGLGLVHNGQYINGVHYEYYWGQGTGDMSWAPIMGVGYYKKVTQWSKGEYAYANNLQNQLAVISSQNNNVDYRAPYRGGSLDSVRYLEIYDGGVAGAEGMIRNQADSGVFEFTTGGGLMSLRATPARSGPNLGIQLSLYDSTGTLLTNNNPPGTLWAGLETNLPAGTYTCVVSGSGRNNPNVDGFSSYGSLGYYSITGMVANARTPSRFSLSENAPAGTRVGVVASSLLANAPLSYAIVSGNLSNTFAIDNLGALTVSNSAVLNYEALAKASQATPQFELFVNVTNLQDPSQIETNLRVLVAITDVNEPPAIIHYAWNSSGVTEPPGIIRYAWNNSDVTEPLVIFRYAWNSSMPVISFCLSTNCPGETTLIEHTPIGAPVGTVVAVDPDAYTLLSYAIIGGNERGAFNIDTHTGLISVAADLAAATQDLYSLAIAISDQTPPSPLVTTSSVLVHIDLPYARGLVHCATYANLSGTQVADLTNAPTFPFEPTWDEYLGSFERTWTYADWSGGGDFGTVLSGYLLPPVTGNYTFWIASCGDSELWLSSTADPASMNRIASLSTATNWPNARDWAKYPDQHSAAIPLAKASAYYIEARMKSGPGTNDVASGNDANSTNIAHHISVAWQCDATNLPISVIPGPYLAPSTPNYSPLPSAPVGFLHVDGIPGIQVAKVNVSDLNPQDQHTFSIIAGNEEGVFFMEAATGEVLLASDTALTASDRTNFDLTVRVTDNGTPPRSGTTTVAIEVVPAGSIAASVLSAEIWTNIAGSSIVDLTSKATFPCFPDLVIGCDAFDSPRIYPDATETPSFWAGLPAAGGTRMRAYLTPTNSGLYTLFVASRDESRLLFSFSTNSAEATIRAYVTTEGTEPYEWTHDVSQQTTVWLDAGNRYYIEAIAKANGPLAGFYLGPPILVGRSHLEVGWAGPGLAGTNAIGAPFLSPLDIEYTPIFSNQSFILPITTSNSAVVTTLTALDSPADRLAYRIVSGNVSNTFRLNPVSGELVVTDNSSFTSYAVSNFNLVVQVQDSGYGGRYPLHSAFANVSLSVIDDSPAFLWTGNGSDRNWSTSSNWDGAVPSGRSKLTFSGPNQLTNYNDLLDSAGLVTLRGKGFRIEGNPIGLFGGITSFGNNTWAIDGSLIGPQGFTSTVGVLTIAGAVNNAGSRLTIAGSSRTILEGVVSGSGGLTKTGLGSLLIASTNTYTGPTVISQGALGLTNAGSVSSSSRIEVQGEGLLDLSDSSGPYLVPAGQALTGNGTIIGPVVVAGTLAPTNATSASQLPYRPRIGTLTAPLLVVTNQLVLQGTTILPLLLDSPTASHSIFVLGDLVYGGNLRVVLNQNQLSLIRPGATYKLFNATRLTGAFTKIDLPEGVSWDTARLTLDGTLRAIGFGPPTPILLPPTISNNSLTLRFATVSGRTYVVESAPSLSSTAKWTTYATRVGNGAQISVFVPTIAKERYFRLRAY